MMKSRRKYNIVEIFLSVFTSQICPELKKPIITMNIIIIKVIIVFIVFISISFKKKFYAVFLLIYKSDSQ